MQTGGVALPRFQRAMAKAAAVLKVSSDPEIVVRGMNMVGLDLAEFIPLFFFGWIVKLKTFINIYMYCISSCKNRGVHNPAVLCAAIIWKYI